jgi:serine/threonine-protein kinase
VSEISEDPNSLKGVVRLGKYELIAAIGSGGMAKVYLARQVGPLNFQKIVVVKSIHEALVETAGFIGMLLDEARIAALIKHANVVDIYDLGQADDGQYFIAMEYIAGRPLSKVLGRSKGTGIMLDVLSIAHVIAEAADGLHAAHTLKSLTGEHLNLVHRDVTPGNIMVTFDGNIKLVDFGVAKSLGNINSTQAGQVKGKLGYLSPEQVNGLEVSPQTDVFSLGVCLWESLVVARLFKAPTMGSTIAAILTKTIEPPSKYRQEVPEQLDRICLKALARDPAQRYPSAAAFRDDLQAFLRGSNYIQGRSTVSKHMEQQFAEDIEADRKLVIQKDFTASISVDSEDELSSPNTAGFSTLTADNNKTPPPPGYEPEPTPPPGHIMAEITAELTDEVTPLPKYDDVTPMVAPIAHANTSGRRLLKAGALGGLVVLVAVLGVLFAGGDSDEKAEAPVDDETPAVAQVDEVPDPVDPVEIPDAATEPLAVEPAPVDAGVEEMVFDPPDPKIKPKVKPETKSAKANALFASGKKKLARADVMGAKKDLAAALKLRPGHAGTLKAMAQVYEKAGVKSKAVQYYRKYLKRSPRAKDRKKIEARISKLGG